MDFDWCSEPNGHLHASTLHLFTMQITHLNRIEQIIQGLVIRDAYSLKSLMLHPCEIRWSWCKSVICCAIIIQTVSAVILASSVQRQKQRLHWATMWILLLEDSCSSDLWFWIRSQTLSTPLQSNSFKISEISSLIWTWENKDSKPLCTGLCLEAKNVGLRFRRLIELSCMHYFDYYCFC